MRQLIELDQTERRVLGALMEKEQTTPEYYPLTLKALVAACNQKTNRYPVLSLAEIDVLNTLRVLQQEGLVERVTGARVDRWEHRVDPLIHYRGPLKAVLTLLLLRGAQTPGELRARAERLHPFESIQAVETVLQELAQSDPPLVKPLARRPGQKETRWTLASEGDEPEPETSISAPAPPRSPDELESLLQRVSQLEDEVRKLRRLIEEIQTQRP